MTTRFSVPVSDESLRVFKNSFFERGAVPERIVEIGMEVLKAMEAAKEIRLIDAAGNAKIVTALQTAVPADIYDLDTFNLYLAASGSSAVFSETTPQV